MTRFAQFLTNPALWSRTAVALWFLFIGVMTADELWSWLGRNPARPTLTDVLVQDVPWWITMTFLCWLLPHFGLTYAAKYGYRLW
jgi:hypothetical protein